MFRYKNQEISDVKFEAVEQEDGSYLVNFPYQSNELIYAKDDFEKTFELLKEQDEIK